MITSIMTPPLLRRKPGLGYCSPANTEKHLHHKVNKFKSRNSNNLHITDLAKAGHTIIDIGKQDSWYLFKLWRRTGKKEK